MEEKLLKQDPVSYGGEQYYIYLTTYTDGKPAIILYHDKELQYDSDLIIASTNLDDTEHDQVAILDDDLFDLLVKEDILQYNGFLGSGYNTYYCGKLL